MVPRYFPGGLRMDRVFMTRLAELLLPPFPRDVGSDGDGRRMGLVRRGALPFLRLWWAVQTRLVPRMAGAPESLVPITPLPGGLERSGVGTEVYQAVSEGRLQVERSEVERFTGPRRLRLASGRELDADVVVFATGWGQSTPFLTGSLADEVVPNGRLHLYRFILPPAEQRMGFVGYASSSACMLTSELAAHWLSQCFRNELTLPSEEEMMRSVARTLRWCAEAFPDRPEGYFIGPYVSRYADLLLGDMELPRHRTGSLLREYLAPLWAERYRTVARDRSRIRARRGGHPPGIAAPDSPQSPDIDACR
jgi:dimethylaniline monooxygenase (N-oxide forming)